MGAAIGVGMTVAVLGVVLVVLVARLWRGGGDD